MPADTVLLRTIGLLTFTMASDLDFMLAIGRLKVEKVVLGACQLGTHHRTITEDGMGSQGDSFT